MNKHRFVKQQCAWRERGAWGFHERDEISLKFPWNKSFSLNFIGFVRTQSFFPERLQDFNPLKLLIVSLLQRGLLTCYVLEPWLEARSYLPASCQAQKLHLMVKPLVESLLQAMLNTQKKWRLTMIAVGICDTTPSIPNYQLFLFFRYIVKIYVSKRTKTTDNLRRRISGQ